MLDNQIFTATQLQHLSAILHIQQQQLLCAGYDVQLDVLNTSVAGVVQNSTLPSVQVLPPTPPTNATPAALLMTLAISSDSLLPFTSDKQRLVQGAVIMVWLLSVYNRVHPSQSLGSVLLWDQVHAYPAVLTCPELFGNPAHVHWRSRSLFIGMC